jgi:D-galactarolactone cycloisomerase
MASGEYGASLKQLIGASVMDLYRLDSGRIVGRNPTFAGLLTKHRHLDAPLYDIIGKVTGKPAWQLIGASARERVPVYDGTLYFSDIWFKDRGIRAVVEECEEAAKSGYAGVKIKLGRGDKWMERKAGDDRDIAVTKAVREAIGPHVKLMADPNYGYRNQYEAAWRLLSAIRDVNLYWMEEIFPETVENYAQLKDKLTAAGSQTKLAAGEHMRDIHAFDPYLQPKRLMDVVQLDIRQGGFLDNAELARTAAAAGSILVPHNWASQIGVVMGLHLSRAVEAVPMAESDRSTCDVLRTDEFRFHAGAYDLPKSPGLGISIDEEAYRKKCQPQEVVIS